MKQALLPFVLAFALVLAPTALAQQAVPAASSPVDNAPVVYPELRGGDEVLFEQTDGEPSNGFPSQDFEAANDAFDARGADDFVIPAGESWGITRVFVLGAYSAGGGPINSVNVQFFEDDDGFVGDLITEFLGIAISDEEVDGDFEAEIPEDFALEAMGEDTRYWVMVQADAAFADFGQWFWTKQATAEPIGFEHNWINEGDGFDTGCTDWFEGASVCGVGGGVEGGLDASFQIIGVRTGTSTEDALVSDGFALDVYPNPAASRSSVALTLAEAQDVSVVVYDVLGRAVATLHDDVLPAGAEHTLALDAGSFTPGVYFVSVRGEDFSTTRRLVVTQ